MQKYLLSLVLLIAIGLLYWKLTAVEEKLNLLLPPEENGRLKGATYLYVPRAMLWTEANAYAKMLGGHLVTIQSEAENKLVYDLSRRSKTQSAVWIGLSDAGKEGEWTWVTGEPVTYTNWESKPNGGRGQNYANIGFTDAYKWHDGDNDGRHAFVVEFEKIPKRRETKPAPSPAP